jgi:hypothetical protein
MARAVPYQKREQNNEIKETEVLRVAFFCSGWTPSTNYKTRLLKVSWEVMLGAAGTDQ